MYKLIIISIVLSWNYCCLQAQPHTSRLQTYAEPFNTEKDIYMRKVEKAFKYEGNMEAIKWYSTDHLKKYRKLKSKASKLNYQAYLIEKDSLGNRSKAKRLHTKAEKNRNLANQLFARYVKKGDWIFNHTPHHYMVFIAHPSFSTEYGLSIQTYNTKSVKRYYLERLESDINIYYNIDECPKFKVQVMEVEKAVSDSIRMLACLAVYTAAYMNPIHTKLDGTGYTFMFESKIAVTHDSGGLRQRDLESVFERICEAIKTNDYNQLQSLLPTVNSLLAEYRSLTLPGQIIDIW